MGSVLFNSAFGESQVPQMGPTGLKTEAPARVANGQECDDNPMAEGIPVVPSRCFPHIVTYPGGNARESGNCGGRDRPGEFPLLASD
jgi:hypothetical protein